MKQTELTDKRLLAATKAALALIEGEESFDEAEVDAFLATNPTPSAGTQAALDALGPDLAERIMRGQVQARPAGLDLPNGARGLSSEQRESTAQAQEHGKVAKPTVTSQREQGSGQPAPVETISGAFQVLVRRETSRRAFFRQATKAAVGLFSWMKAGFAAAGEQQGKCDWSVDDLAGQESHPGFKGPRSDSVKALFFPAGGPLFHYVPAGIAPHAVVRRESGTYANEEDAMAALRGMFPAAENQPPKDLAPEDDHNWALLGSNVSNEFVRRILGDPESPRFEYSTEGGLHVDLAYTILVDRDNWTSRVQDGKEYETELKTLVSKACSKRLEPACERVRGVRHPRLATDYLLVTKFPKSREGLHIVSFSGLHGPACRAIRQLLYDIDPHDLDHIREVVGEHNAFQAIFEVSGLKVARDERTKLETTVPKYIRLVRGGDYGPKPIAVRFRKP